MKEDITLKEMESDFDALYQNNDYKETLLKDEIRGYKLLFDKDELPLSGFSKKDKPLREYDIPYSTQQIFLIREFHRLYNVKKNDISKMYKTDWDSQTKYIYDSSWGDFLEPNALSEPHGPKYYILLAKKLSKYLEWLEKEYPVQNSETIISREHIGLIFDKFKDYFEKETKACWTIRFCYPGAIPVEPILVRKEAREGSDRLILIAILASIQKYIVNVSNFEDFVLDRFGIKGYEKAKSIHKYKSDFRNAFEKCNAILEK